MSEKTIWGRTRACGELIDRATFFYEQSNGPLFLVLVCVLSILCCLSRLCLVLLFFRLFLSIIRRLASL